MVYKKRSILFYIQYNRNGAIANSHTINSHINQFQEMLSGTDTAASFNLHFVSNLFLHDLNNLRGCTVDFVTREKSCGGLYIICSGFQTTVTAFANLLLIQCIGFQDNLDFSSVFVCSCNAGLEIFCHFIIFSH